MQSITTPPSQIPIFSFSTLEFQKHERFDAWVQGNHCECRLRDDDAVSFDADSSGAAIGPFILSRRRWLNPSRTAPYILRRSERLVRTDGQDFYWFSLIVNGRTHFRSSHSHVTQTAHTLRIADAAQVHECEIETGDMISLAVPRDSLPKRTALLHGRLISSGIGSLFSDHLLSVFKRLPYLTEDDMPNLVQSTLQLMTAAVSPTEDVVRAANNPIRDTLFARVQRYLDAHLLDSDLTPERICREVGLSRAMLYQLFEGSGGVVRQIQRKRLHRSYLFLANPSRPRTSVAEIAWRHGFSSDKHFHRLFKAEFGHTPGETMLRLPELDKVLHGNAPGAQSNGLDRPSGWTLPFGIFKS
jgi:AraC-like DNA-binding protein